MEQMRSLHSSLSTDPLAAAMPGPWLLLTLVLTLTLTGSPGGRAQPQAAQLEAEMAAEHPGLDDLLRQAERFLLFQDDIQRLRGDLGEPSGEWAGLLVAAGGELSRLKDWGTGTWGGGRMT